MTATWIKKSTNHHKNRHKYEFYVKAPTWTRGDYCYLVHTTYDLTAEEEVDYYDHFSSEISLKQSFKIDSKKSPSKRSVGEDELREVVNE